MWPGFFECLQLKNFLSKKNMKKIVFLEKCFLYIFCFRTFPLQWCLSDLFCKKEKQSENAGHMRPGPWKSWHPREEKFFWKHNISFISEYSAMLQYFGNILLWNTKKRHCVNLLLKEGFCWLKESPPPLDPSIRE